MLNISWTSSMNKKPLKFIKRVSKQTKKGSFQNSLKLFLMKYKVC